LTYYKTAFLVEKKVTGEELAAAAIRRIVLLAEKKNEGDGYLYLVT
jgi:hypothetical protein